MAGVLVAVAVAGSLFSFPVAGSKCVPVQRYGKHMRSDILGPVWSVGVAFCASVIRNLIGLGSLMAFPGSMVGALCCGLMYKFSKKIIPTCIAEALGTGILGGLVAIPACKICDAHTTGWNVYLYNTFPDFDSCRKCSRKE